MNAALLLPFQTAFDPPQQSEGSLDPLGLYSVADALGVQLAPGVRERQSKPRYLTLALVGALICQDLEEGPDPRRPPAWLAYEWLVVMALVRQLRGTSGLHGIPGRDKVGDCLARNEPVCASNYLKTPSVFGFHGIYKVFGVKAGLFSADLQTLDAGRRVLRAWEADQALAGFIDRYGQAGHMRQQIRRAVQAGLDSRQMVPPAAGISAWIAKHLNPHVIGRGERDALWGALTATDRLRGEYAELLTTPQGQLDWRAADGSEAAFHGTLRGRTTPQMSLLLQAIAAFERLARLLVDAFDEARWRMTGSGLVDADWLAQGACMQQAAQQTPAALKAALDALREVDRDACLRLESALASVCEPQSPQSFAIQLLAHHERVQRRKPPNGKRSWFDTFTDGRIGVRGDYENTTFAAREGRYVHAYRTLPLWSFARDLGRVTEEVAA